MPVYFPVESPYDDATYVVHEKYDASQAEPSGWQMSIAFERTESFSARAVCGGKLSTVAPWELRESEIPLSKVPDGVVPTTVQLYLEPNLSFVSDVAGFNSALKDAGLGDTVRCYVYGNIDANNLAASVVTSINSRKDLKAKTYTDQARLGIFTQGEIAVSVTAGTLLGSAYTGGAGTNQRLTFGVLTTIGFVDPVIFFEVVQAYLATTDSGDLIAFKDLVGTSWPILSGPTSAEMIAVASARLYPFPVLHAAKVSASLTDVEWRQVGDAQKALYKARLHSRAAAETEPPAFTFNTADMANVFQLEAVTEFFMKWTHPATDPEPVPTSTGITTDFPSCDWTLVLVDPFDHERLGSPDLPKPNYALSGHTLSAKGACHKDSSGNADPPGPTYIADTYRAVLFLIQAGEVRRWFRWSTYTCHKWEDKGEANCKRASSIQGNVRHDFISQKATGTSPGSKFINYAFWLWDPSQQPATSKKTASRQYFRAGEPEEAGGKTGIMIHLGLASTKDKAQAYNGSGGCLVSPEFPRFRKVMIDLYIADRTSRNESTAEIEKLQGKGHEECKKIFSGQTLFKGARFGAENWNSKISGDCWVIRPDEPTQK